MDLTDILAPPTEEREAGAQRDVGAVVHAIRILQYLADATAPLGVAAVSRGTGISPSTCFNILRTLARARFVAFNSVDKVYSLGLGVAELAAGLVGISPADLIRPELERLALNYDMLIVLWRVMDEGHIALVDRAHSATAVRVEMRLGLRLPTLVGAVGRCFAAATHLPEAELRRRFGALRWQDPPSFETYLADIAEARERGWAREDGNLYRGLVTVAALVTDQAGRPRFGISGITIAGQHPSETIDRLGAELKDVCAFIGTSLFPRHLGG
ncbi:transcriptional regulator [Aliidongia dinghuensis]|uniref:Transcriptional regulator n=1 Tax=Aliidongia dinghuensis TaxID=1867774 RepID=A0A8J2YSK4_9PROT|nr:IclR family transcriptional regulator [Aliidongia dinghuensis]GGF15483.1 transcriptional regulator [Aliidongia dinghuensis]